MGIGTTASNVADFLLQIKAVKLSPSDPFKWASGWNSPIYCDNRVTLSHPRIRTYIRQELVKLIDEKFGTPDMIAGVATGAIAQGALVAEAKGLPFVYVRPTPKDHGTKNQVEGEVKQNQTCVVVEDLISTGQSSLKAVHALREAGVVVKGMVSIFTYGFPQAADAFKSANCPMYSLSNYDVLIDRASVLGYITDKDLERLRVWRESPDKWA
ncbi:MAG: orotate phosphoribosyltransferase [Bacteroidota bacterium]|jgi:orotate phosphoribosyltransferase